jgi:dolichol-phosphate mannosyltransferase
MSAAVPSPTQRPEVSIVIPAYNEEECIIPCLEEVAGVMDAGGQPYEIIVVDDGSRDGTFPLLKAKKAELPQLVVLRFSTNNGQTAAFDAGFRAAAGRVIVTMDADMQNDPADIPRLLDVVGEYDVACGYRRKRRDSLLRRLSSRIANGVRNRLSHESIRDVGCSLRAFRAECIPGLKLYTGMHRFLPTLLRLDGWTVTEVPVNHRPRKMGTAKYGVWNRVFRGLRDLLAVRWMQKRWLRYQIVERIE